MKKIASIAALFVLMAAATAEAQNRSGGSRLRQGAGSNSSGNARSQFLPPDFDWSQLFPGKPGQPQPAPQPKRLYEISEIRPFDGLPVETKRFEKRDQAVAYQTRILNKYWVLEKALFGPEIYSPFASYGDAVAYRRTLQVPLGPYTELRRGQATGITEVDPDTVGSLAKPRSQAKTQQSGQAKTQQSGQAKTQQSGQAKSRGRGAPTPGGSRLRRLR